MVQPFFPSPQQKHSGVRAWRVTAQIGKLLAGGNKPPSLDLDAPPKLIISGALPALLYYSGGIAAQQIQNVGDFFREILVDF